MTADEFIIQVQRVLKSENAPIVYVHNAEGDMVACIISRETLKDLKFIDETGDSDRWLNHGHVEPGMW